MFKQVAVKLADKILDGVNPVVPFGLTYEIHEIFEERGIIVRESVTTRTNHILYGWRNVTREMRYPIRILRYRVSHGGGYMTQNTWYDRQVVPDSVDIKVAA